MIKRILLLGKNGQVGWELQRALAPLGQLVMHDRTTCDLAYSNSLARVIKSAAPDIIVNAAAYTAVDRAEKENEKAYQINAEAVAQLANAAADHNALLVHYSTDYVFDGHQELPYSETDIPNPLSIYGASKQGGERAIIASGCDHLIFRTSWVFAARGANFAKTMLRMSMEREELRVVADQFGAPTSAELIADVTAHALRAVGSKAAPGGLYHLSAGGETSWHGYAAFVIEYARALGLPVKTQVVKAITTAEYPLPAARPVNSRLNTEKLQSTFNLTLPRWQLHVERMLAELLEKPDAIRQL